MGEARLVRVAAVVALAALTTQTPAPAMLGRGSAGYFSIVIVDDCHVRASDFRPYVSSAQAAGAEVRGCLHTLHTTMNPLAIALGTLVPLMPSGLRPRAPG